MWSGPRNISTAMMRSWGNRPDTFVCDEPLYAHYLLKTGARHPGADEVIAHHDTDLRKVIQWLTGPVPDKRTIFYQKHMTHHLLPEIDRTWLESLSHAFLIRDPHEMLISLIKHLPNPTIRDTGLPQQVEIFELVRTRSARTPPVVDARDVLENPRRMLSLLCEALDVPFVESMLMWPAGPRETDGIWAKHWYHSVEQSTTFEPYRPRNDRLPESLRPLLVECQEWYKELHTNRLR